MTKHDAIKHLSYKIAYYKGIDRISGCINTISL